MIAQGCTSGETDVKNSEPAEVELREILTISNENILEQEDLVLGTPYQTLTDHDNNIYILDPRQNIIFMFSSSGEFIHTFGQGGSGPGEFQSVNGMLITDNNQLMVLDFPSQQYTVFHSDGSVDRISNLEYPYGRFKPKVHSNSLLLPWGQNGKLIHTYDMELDSITNRFVDIDDILQTDQEYEETLLNLNTGSVLVLSDERIIFVPVHYNGIVYVYEKTDGRWMAGEHISGYRHIDQTFSIHETTDAPHSRAQTIIPQSSSIIGIELHSWSLGLFALRDDTFAHLSLTNIDLEGDEFRLVIEQFNAEEVELSTYAISDQLSLTARPEQMPVWMDPDGYLYVADMRDDPALRKFELVW